MRERLRIQRIPDHPLRTCGELAHRGGPDQCTNRVSARNQLRNEMTPDVAGGPSDEDVHDGSYGPEPGVDVWRAFAGTILLLLTRSNHATDGRESGTNVKFRRLTCQSPRAHVSVPADSLVSPADSRVSPRRLTFSPRGLMCQSPRTHCQSPRTNVSAAADSLSVPADSCASPRGLTCQSRGLTRRSRSPRRGWSCRPTWCRARGRARWR